jgi:hypothetical protein
VTLVAKEKFENPVVHRGQNVVVHRLENSAKQARGHAAAGQQAGRRGRF